MLERLNEQLLTVRDRVHRHCTIVDVVKYRMAYLQDELPATGEDSDAGNGGGRSTSWTTGKKMA